MSRKSIPLPVTELVTQYEAGESTHVLGRAYGVGQMTVWRRLVAAGTKMRPRGGPLGGKNGNKHKPGGPLFDSGKGYLITHDREGKNHRVHRGCWEAYHGPIPDGHDIHHINKDQLNNTIKNLTCMSHGKHTSWHRKRRSR